MSTITVGPGRRLDVLHPLVAAGVGAVTFASTMIAGEMFDINADADDAPAVTLVDLGVYAGLVLVAIAVAVWLGGWARSGSPDRLSRASLGLGVASAATFVGFWSGWPHVFGAVAVALALEHRRRVGSLSGVTATALVLGTLSFLATSWICLVG